MRKFIMTATTVTVVGLGSVFFTNSAHAEPAKTEAEIKSERAEVKANLTKAEAEIADVLLDLKDINAEIERIQQALAENEKVIETTKTNITKRENEIDALEEEIADLEKSIQIRFEKLKDRVASYQQNGGDIQYLEVLFGSKSFVDFISRATAVIQLTNADVDIMESIEKDKVVVEEKKSEIEGKLNKLKEDKVELEGMNQVIKEQKKEQESKKATLNEKEEKLTALKADLESKDNNLAALEDQIRRDMEAAANAVATASNNDGSNNDVNVVPATNNTSNSGNTGNSNKASNTTKAAKTESKPAAPSAPVSTGKNISVAINAGYPHLGTPYVWGGKGPGGFDCSGFVSWAFKQAGYSIPSSTAGLQSTGTKVSYSNIQPGDLVFFDTYKKNGHVGIYIGNGQWIGAQNSTGLAVASMNNSYWKSKFKGHVRRIN